MDCNGTAKPFESNEPTNESCVNWNQYYTDCRPGDKNPFQGTISFDNIGLAWVAIFLVSADDFGPELVSLSNTEVCKIWDTILICKGMEL